VASSWFFYSSVITMMHGPINNREVYILKYLFAVLIAALQYFRKL